MFDVGDKVRFAQPTASPFESDHVKAGRFLVLDAVYTVGKVQVAGPFTGIWLDEIANQRFNGLMFEQVHN